MCTLKDRLYDTIHRNHKPLKAIAEEIGMSENYLARAALPDQEESDTGSGCRFPLKKLIPLIRATDNFSVLDYIEDSLGRVAITIPTMKTTSKPVYRLAMKADKEFGELMAELESDLADGKLNTSEKERIA
jgi:hypothetical protein